MTGEEPNKFIMTIAIKEAIKWLPITFRGCPTGAFHAVITSMLLAPKEAMNHNESVKLVNSNIVNIQTKTPMEAMSAS